MTARGYWERLELFVISLGPLFALLLVFTFRTPSCSLFECGKECWISLLVVNKLALFFAVMIVLGVIFYFRFAHRLKQSARLPVRIVEIEDINYEHLTFFGTYIVPLVSFDLGEQRSVIIMLALLSLTGLIYIRTNMFCANPVLAVLGYRLYRVDLNTRTGIERRNTIITKEVLRKDDQARTIDLGSGIHYARKVD